MKDITNGEAVAILQVMRADIARMTRDTLNESRIIALNKAIKMLKIADKKERAANHENTKGTTV
jgi:hypothetical protein